VGNVAGTTTGLVEILGEFVQLEDVKDPFSCKIQPELSGVHEMVACPGPAATMLRYGPPGVCTAVAQNPLLSSNVPPDSGPLFASG